MSSEDRVSELLLVWEERAERGQPVTPQELCQDYPDLLPELAQRIKALQALRPMVDATVVQSATPGRTPTTVDGEEATRSTPAPSRYQPVRFHAEGGLGVVFVAQDEEMHREVALKRMKARATQDAKSCRRFLVEAEVTGRLEHPGVVPVYGMGHDGEGRPFYAMRFIQGETLQEAVRSFHEGDRSGRDPGERALAFRQLLTRFITICNTVAYAHSRKIVHRDLKPANTMLGKYGETLVVDWGLARPFTRTEGEDGGAEVTLTPSTDSAEGTALGQALGTPAYMSPEQAEGRWDVIGPASDIYSLGATLYVLLTGQVAFEGRSVGEVLDRVKRGDFQKPRQRKADVPRTLEAVCLKAMALRPEDRYASALDLAADLEHWLADEPVTAYREPVTARLRRWGRRHRTVVTAAAVLLVTAVAALTGGVILLERKQAEVITERNAAQKARDQARAVAKFYEDHVLAAPRPKGFEGGASPQVTMREALDRAIPKIDKAFARQPELEAAVRHTLGVTYFYLGRYEAARIQGEKAYKIRIGLLGPDHPDTIRSANELAEHYYRVGKLDESVALYREVIERGRRVLGSKDEDILYAPLRLGSVLEAKGQLDEAEKLLRQGIEACKLTLGADHHHTFCGQARLSDVLTDKGKAEDALALKRQTFEGRRRALGENAYDTLLSMGELGSLLRRQGKLAEAEPILRRNLEVRSRVLGIEHNDTLYSKHHVAFLLEAQGKHAEAEKLHREALEVWRRVYGPEEPDTLTCMENLASNLDDQGKQEEAAKLYEQSLTIKRRVHGLEHRDTLDTLYSLAGLRERQGKMVEAEKLYRQLIQGNTHSYGAEHKATMGRQQDLAFLLEKMGKPNEALAQWRDILHLMRKNVPPDPLDLAMTLVNFGALLATNGQAAEAESLLREGLEIREKKLPSKDWRIPSTRSILGASLARQGKFAECEPMLLTAYEALTKANDAPPEWVAKALDRIIDLYEKWKKPDEAKKWRAKRPPAKK